MAIWKPFFILGNVDGVQVDGQPRLRPRDLRRRNRSPGLRRGHWVHVRNSGYTIFILMNKKQNNTFRILWLYEYIFILFTASFFKHICKICIEKTFKKCIDFFLGFWQRWRLRCSPHGRVDRIPRHEADDARKPTQQHLRHVKDFKYFNFLCIEFK